MLLSLSSPHTRAHNEPLKDQKKVVSGTRARALAGDFRSGDLAEEKVESSEPIEGSQRHYQANCNSSNASSMSIEAPRGCLWFFLLQGRLSFDFDFENQICDFRFVLALNQNAAFCFPSLTANDVKLITPKFLSFISDV